MHPYSLQEILSKPNYIVFIIIFLDTVLCIKTVIDHTTDTDLPKYLDT